MKKCNTILQHLYLDSGDLVPGQEEEPGHDTIIHDAVITDYIPFAMEKQLCFADSVRSSKPLNRYVAHSETLRFVPCHSLAMVESGEDFENINDAECSFEITDSELLNCCYQIDNMTTGTPQKRLHVVNSILEDFSLSPITTKHNATAQFWEYSPEFVLKTKPSKTYKCKRRNEKPVDCNKRLYFGSNDECNSVSSSISIEENPSHLENISNTTVIPDTSERLCENLLNLSAYYTQTRPVVITSKEMVISSAHAKDIGLLREKRISRRTRCSSYSSSEDFCGFPDEKGNRDCNGDQSCIPDADRELIMNYEGECFADINEGCHSIKSHYIDEWNDDFEDVFALIKTPPHNYTPTSSPPSKHNSEVSNIVTTKRLSRNLLEIESRLISNNSRNMRDPYNKEADSKTNMNTNIISELPSTSKAAMKARRKYEDIQNNDGVLAMLQPHKIRVIETPLAINKLEGVAICNNIITRKLSDESVGLHTANGTKLIVSEKAKMSFESRTGFSTDSHDLKLLKNNINRTNSKLVPVEKLHSSEEANKWSNNHHNIVEKQKFVGVSSLAISNKNMGFKTANGKNIIASAKALKSVERLLKDIQTETEQNGENDLVDLKIQIHQKKLKQTTANAKNINDDNFWSENVDFANGMLSKWPSTEDVDMSHSTSENGSDKKCSTLKSSENKICQSLTIFNKNMGFQTANGKNISASAKALKCVEKLFKEIQKDSGQNCERELEAMKKQVYKKKIKQSTSDAQTTNIENAVSDNLILNKCPAEERLHILKTTTTWTSNNENSNSGPSLATFNENMGLQTTNGKNINAPIALKTDEKILTEVQTESEPFGKNKIYQRKYKQPQFEAEIVNDINLCTEDVDLANVILSEWPLKDRLDSTSAKPVNEINNEIKRTDMKCAAYTELKGFCTASGKEVTISENAKKIANSLLSNFQNDCRINDYENTLLEFKNNIQKKSARTLEDSNLHKLQSETETYTGKSVINKSHLSAKCSFTELSVKSPLNTSATNSIISRKNLLSLSKKRKRNTRITSTREETNDIIEKVNPIDLGNKCTETPIKTDTLKNHINQLIQTPSTPNINEFFHNALKCSTPRSELVVTPSRVIDNDFKPISWELHNKTTTKLSNINKPSDDTSSNISINSPHSSVNERITRLQMYGEAPPISPLLANFQKNCRSSGLRRTRSMIKKNENI